MTKRPSRWRIKPCLAPCMKEFHHSRHCLSFQEWFPDWKSSRTFESTRTQARSPSHSIITCHLFIHFSRFKNKKDHTHTDTAAVITLEIAHFYLSLLSSVLTSAPVKPPITKEPTVAVLRCFCWRLSEVVSFSVAWQIWNKSTVACVFLDAYSCEGCLKF